MSDPISGLASRQPAAGAVPRHRRCPPTVLAVVDMRGGDAQVLAATRALTERTGAAVVLLHVASPVSLHHRPNSRWERVARGRMAAVDARAQHALRQLAGRWLPRKLLVRTAVRFGEVVEQVAKAAMGVGATLVVASSTPARWLWWRSRDRRLRRTLDIPLIVVPTRAPEIERARAAASYL